MRRGSQKMKDLKKMIATTEDGKSRWMLMF